ncbi:hypothetical protein V7S43_015804 [Phytophthora oleae]|uniref:Elicitin-like protein n=1 Tax=Phytophthora oleae TaxID=2107226 RepID=A0ABD3EY52_9STRA
MKMFATIALTAIASVAAQDSPSECTAEYLTSTRNACDSVADVSQLKCDNEACHEALHSLVEDEVRQCYVDLGLGPVTDMDYYTLLDEFCHGDGVDPADLAATGSTAGSNSTGSGTGGTTVGDDHDHDHDHSHDHDESAASASASGSSSGNVAQALVALQLLAAAAVTLLV